MEIKRQSAKGFTIVEVAIVVVIIGFLAILSFVGYNGMRTKAINTSLQSDLSTISDQLNVDQARSSTGSYPATLAAVDNNNGVKWSNNPTSTYTVNNTGMPKTFCLSATKDSATYFITQEGTPMPGPCPVFYVDFSIETSYPRSGTAIYDLSGRGNNGTVYNGGSFGSEYGGAFSFDGIDDYAAFSTMTLDNRNASLELWLRHPGTSVASGGDGAMMFGSRTGIMTVSSLTNLYGLTWDTAWSTTRNVQTPPINDSLFHQIDLTLDSNYLKLYCDGVYIGQSDTLTGFTMPSIGDSIVMGRRSATFEWQGAIAIARIYNKTLSSDEVKANFENLRSRFGR